MLKKRKRLPNCLYRSCDRSDKRFAVHIAELTTRFSLQYTDDLQAECPGLFAYATLFGKKKKPLTLLMHGGIPVIHLGKTSLDSRSSFCTSLP